MNIVLKDTTYLRRDAGIRQNERERFVGKEEGIDDGRREVWENNHRKEMSHKREPGNSMETCGTHKDSGRRRGLGMSHRESRVWPRTSWTPIDVGLE